jgi:hypothetical protein
MVEKERRAKTETLSLRLDPKTRFILAFMSKVEGQSITVLVERSVREAAARVRIGPEHDERGNDLERYTWSDFWDANEGVRTLKLLTSPHYPTDFADDELKSFTDTHWPFFYYESGAQRIRRAYVEVLWPRIEQYLAIWQDTKSSNYWKAGEEMGAALVAARVAPPDWPGKPPTRTPSKSAPAFESGGMDDDIPF